MVNAIFFNFSSVNLQKRRGSSKFLKFFCWFPLIFKRLHIYLCLSLDTIWGTERGIIFLS